MARPTRYRTPQQLAVVADNVLARFASKFSWTRALPIPIEQIVERLYELKIDWLELDETPGTSILGALDPSAKTIVLNTRHEQLFSDVLGPYEFTLAHELGHLLFDADDRNQLSLLDAPTQRFCHSWNSPAMSKEQHHRERNADRFAAELLLPADLVAQVDAVDLVAHVSDYARIWGVSRRALTIRLETLGILAEGPLDKGLW